MSFLIPGARMLYIHIPKCAGNTMRRWFGERYRVDPQIPNDRTLTDNYHSTVEDAERFLGGLGGIRVVTSKGLDLNSN